MLVLPINIFFEYLVLWEIILLVKYTWLGVLSIDLKTNHCSLLYFYLLGGLIDHFNIKNTIHAIINIA